MEASMQAAGESSPLAHFRQIFQLLRLSSSGTGAKHTMLANNVNLTIFTGRAANSGYRPQLCWLCVVVDRRARHLRRTMH